MKLSKEDFLARVQTLIGEDTSDEAIATLEDFTDTYTELESTSTGGENWEQKFKENDEAWRKKYRERFSGASQSTMQDVTTQEDDKVTKLKEITIDDLFK